MENKMKMKNKNIVEIARFKLMRDADEKKFLRDAANVQKEFLEKQPGYGGMRQLLKGKGGEWIDIVLWKSKKHAENAQKAAMKSKTCMSMFQKINPKSIKMSHFEQVKEWKRRV